MFKMHQIDLTQPAPRLPPCPLFALSSMQTITVYPSWWLKNATEGKWMPCKEASCVEFNNLFHSGGTEWRGAFKYYDRVVDHPHGDMLMWETEDLCWSCPHRECFFGAVKEETKMYVDGTPYVSWYDLYEQDLELRKAAAEKKGEVFVVKKSEILEHLEKLETDEDYKKADDIGKWLSNNLTDKKRSAGGTWKLDKELVCKYAARVHWNEKGVQEKVIVYEYVNPLLGQPGQGKKAKHFYAECWMWEYTHPKTKQRHTPHTCNCFHPGQKGWKDEWLWNKDCAAMYDRLEDWFKYYYNDELKQWVYEPKRTIKDCDRTRVKETKAAAPARETSNKAEGKSKPKPKANTTADGWHTVLAPQDARKEHATIWEQQRKK
jgi:hypothetical protein